MKKFNKIKSFCSPICCILVVDPFMIKVFNNEGYCGRKIKKSLKISIALQSLQNEIASLHLKCGTRARADLQVSSLCYYYF